MAEAPRRIEVKEEEEEKGGFFSDFGDILKNVALQKSAEVGIGALFDAPLKARQAKIADRQNEFLMSESAIQARRNNKLANTFKTTYDNALRLSLENNTTLAEELADSKFFTTPVLNEIKNNNPNLKGLDLTILNDNEINQMTRAKRLAAVEKDLSKLQEIYDSIKNIRSEAEFAKYLKTIAPRSNGVILNTFNKLKGIARNETLEDLAFNKLNADERYSNSLIGLKSLEAYRNNPNKESMTARSQLIEYAASINKEDFMKHFPRHVEVTTIKEILEVPGTDGTQFAEYITTKTLNRFTGDTTQTKEIIPDTQTVGVGLAGDDLTSRIKDVKMTKEAQVYFRTQVNKLAKDMFPNGVETVTGERRDFNLFDYKAFATREGLEVRTKALELLANMAEKQGNFQEFNPELAEAFRKEISVARDMVLIQDNILNTYGGDVKIVNNKLFVRDNNNKLIDATKIGDDPVLKNKVGKFKKGQETLKSIADYIHLKEKNYVAAKQGQISIVNINRAFEVGNQTVVINDMELAAPLGATKFERGSFFFPDTVSKAQRDISRMNFRAYLANQVIRETRTIDGNLVGIGDKGGRFGITPIKSEEIKITSLLDKDQKPEQTQVASVQKNLIYPEKRPKEDGRFISKEEFRTRRSEFNNLAKEIIRFKNPDARPDAVNRQLQVYQKKGLPAELINEYRSAFTKVEDIAPDPNTILALN